MVEKIVKTKEEWLKLLTPEQYAVCREKGTERPFTGKYNNTNEPGTYVCVCCGEELFASDAKFNSSCGWPSFNKASDSVEEHEDHSHGMWRTEVTCNRCDAHLGHVFDDGPPPTGLRYCINSLAIQLVEEG